MKYDTLFCNQQECSSQCIHCSLLQRDLHLTPQGFGWQQPLKDLGAFQAL